MKSVLGSLFIALGVLGAGLLMSQAVVKFKTLDRDVEVRGLAERVVDSNHAIWSMSFSASSEQLADVNSKILQLQSQVIQFVTEQGFRAEEVSKAALQITDKTTQEYSEAKGPRFIARGEVIVSTGKVQEATAASQKTDELLKRGVALSSSQVRYYFTDLNAIKPAMLEEATLSAREAAQSFARSAGAEVGEIKKATQGLFTISSPLVDYDSESSVKKKVRVVTQVVFYLD